MSKTATPFSPTPLVVSLRSSSSIDMMLLAQSLDLANNRIMILITIILVFTSSLTHAIDLNFRFQKGYCQKNGQPGGNPNFYGECGNLTGSSIIQKITKDENLTGLILNSTYIYTSHFIGGNLNHSSLRRSHILQSTFKNMSIQTMDIRGSFLKGVEFQKVDLQQLLASGTRFTQVTFKECDLRGADFWGSQLLDTDFSDSDLRGANLDSTFVLLSKFNGARFNDATKLPFSVEEALQKGMVKVD